jgi:uncharacterized cupin superfamily protein
MTSRALDTLTTTLDDLPLDECTVLTGAPTAGLATVGALAGVEVGVWELTPGTVTDTEVDELFVVVAGAGTVTFSDGESIALRPGILVRLDAGDQTTWVITETLRKVWISD